ncbi:MAG: D-alanine--D-alanine ligase, partial [Planctomycetota bacterium]
MTRRTVAVLMGGTSPEHGVSLKSGATMWRGLASAGHRVLAVVMSRDGLWNLLDDSVLPDQLPVEAPGAPSLPHRRGDALAITALLKAESVDIVMIGLHGPGGEDGSIQGFFEVAGLPYTGPGIPCSAVAMDKLWLKRLLKAEGLPTSDWLEFTDDEVRGGDVEALVRKAHEWVVSAG